MEQELTEPAVETLRMLHRLVGTWYGEGKGYFPTIDSFLYRECFTVKGTDEAPYFTFEQATDLVDASGSPLKKSHWEAGVIRPLENGDVEVSCAHDSGRVEVLRGKATGGELMVVSLESVLVDNDARMKSSSREWQVSGESFIYEMAMATSGVSELTAHLECRLERARCSPV